MFRFVNSIRFRVWFLFMGFTMAMLVFLYINQIFMLPAFYNLIKTQETIATANMLKNLWENDKFSEEVKRLAIEQEMFIRVDIYPKNGIGRTVVFMQDPEGNNSISLGGFIVDESLFQSVLESKNGMVKEYRKRDAKERPVLTLSMLVGTKNNVKGFITIFNYIEPLDNTRSVLKSQFFLSSCILLIVAFVLSVFVVVSISNPIINISRCAKKLPKGEFNMRIRNIDYLEIQYLADNLNKASHEISKTENLRKDLIANVSHDLKTPLTMIKAYAEMIRDLSGDNPEKREKHVQVIIDEADRLNGLVADMLDLSRLQSGVAQKNMASFDFSLHLSDLLSRFDYLSEQEYKIIPEIEESILIKADLPKIEQVVYNLVNNAINYTGDDGKVTVRLYRKKPLIGRFEVTDTGSGIPMEELPYIWEKYYKSEKSVFHKRTVIGSGLGLSIVKGIMEIHGFSYGTDSTLGIGTTFWFEFPCE